MTIETVQFGNRAESDLDDLLLWERELMESNRVGADFAAIMIASGFGDRVIVAADPGPREGTVLSGSLQRQPGSSWSERRMVCRVRSPPARR